MYTPLHTHMTHTYMHTHTHTHTHSHRLACTTCSDFGLLFLTLYSQSMYMCKKTLAHCYVNSPYTIFVTNTYTHTYTHTLTWAHTDWACNACSDFGFLFLTLSLQSVHVHECTHMCTHTCTHTHTHTHTETGLVPLAEFLQSVHVHE